MKQKYFQRNLNTEEFVSSRLNTKIFYFLYMNLRNIFMDFTVSRIDQFKKKLELQE